MAAIVDYATLSTALADWAERTVDADQIIGLAEAEFRLYLGPNFAKQTSSTPTFTSGSAALPAGFVRPIASTHSTYGPLDETDIGTVRVARINGDSIPTRYALTGSTIEIDATYSGTDITFDYEGTLSGVSSGNTTNWLVLNGPQAYLSMCRSMIEARAENLAQAAQWRATSLQVLSDLGIQSNVAQYGRAAVTIAGPTP